MEVYKTLISFLVKRVHLDGKTEAGKIQIDVEWHTAPTIDRPLVGVRPPKTPPAAVERIRELLPGTIRCQLGQFGVSRLCRLAAPGMMKMELGFGSLWLEAGVG